MNFPKLIGLGLESNVLRLQTVIYFDACIKRNGHDCDIFGQCSKTLCHSISNEQVKNRIPGSLDDDNPQCMKGSKLPQEQKHQPTIIYQ